MFEVKYTYLFNFVRFHEAPHYAVFSSLLLLPLCKLQMPSSVSCSVSNTVTLFSLSCHRSEYFYVKQETNMQFISINVQRDATICGLYSILLQDHSTCFGCCPHPSSGVHKTVVTATGTSHMIVQLPHSDVAN